MSQLVRVASVAEVPEGSAKEVLAGETILALFHVNGERYAVDGICPHNGGPLAEGEVIGTTVTCPWHGWQFDVATGANKLNPRICVTRYPVIVEGEELYVELP